MSGAGPTGRGHHRRIRRRQGNIGTLCRLVRDKDHAVRAAGRHRAGDRFKMIGVVVGVDGGDDLHGHPRLFAGRYGPLLFIDQDPCRLRQGQGLGAGPDPGVDLFKVEGIDGIDLHPHLTEACLPELAGPVLAADAEGQQRQGQSRMIFRR